MSENKTFNIMGFEALLMRGHYQDGTTAIWAVDVEDGEEVGTLTVSIPEKKHLLKQNEILVKLWSENHVFKKLEECGVFKNTLKTIKTGLTQAEVWEIVDESALVALEQ